MRLRKPKQETIPPSCPSAWTIGPFRSKGKEPAYRDACPVCGKKGIATGDGVSMLHI